MYSQDTQILTNIGWRYLNELQGVEQFMTYDIQNNYLYYKVMPEVIEKEVTDEPMKLFENRHISLLVTADHNLFCQVKKSYQESYDASFQFVRADELKLNYIIRFLLASKFNIQDTDKDIKTDEFYYIYGFYLSNSTESDGVINITTTDCSAIERLTKSIDYLKCEYALNKIPVKFPNGKEVINYNISINQDSILYDRLKKFDSYYSRKSSALYDIISKSKTARENFIKGYIGENTTYTFSSESYLDLFQALLAVTEKRNHTTGTKNKLSYDNEQTTQIDYSNRKSDVPYTGMVYGINSEDVYLLRRNGRIFIN